MFTAKKMMGALAALALIVSGCAAEGGQTGDGELATSNMHLVEISGDSCVTLLAGQTIDVGTVCTAINGDNVDVTYSTTGGWGIYEAHLWAGTSLADMPQNKKGNPKIGNFPYNDSDLGGVTSHTISVPLSTFGLDATMTSCDPVTAFIASHAVVKKDNGDGTFQGETAWGAGTRMVQKGSWATYFSMILVCTDDEEPEEPSVGTCETAFARTADGSNCFLDMDYNGDGEGDFNRWGWTLGPLTAGSYSFDIYGGAGQCDTTKGTLVGKLNVDYDGSTVTATFATLSGFAMNEVHLYAGSDPLPKDKDGDYTVAPGQYTVVTEFDSDKTSYSADVATAGGAVYVTAHAVVCGAY
ncbi:MAG: hypothetical protein KC502_18380 [Myxococcales bacterium]|nr:hypothetical protein [Myxococcales bacterium]